MIFAAATLGLLNGAWMVFDGRRALTQGDYLTPGGKGQLGPWARVLETFGIPPRARAMKLTFIALGGFQLLAALGTFLAIVHAPLALFILALLTLWYAPVGTVLSGLQMGILYWVGVLG